jgi:nitrate reductase beta subunit
MGPKTIPDSELVDDADRVTIWIASPPGPKDIWSLREAVRWAAKMGPATLHRPTRDGVPSAWVKAAQVARLVRMLADHAVADAE